MRIPPLSTIDLDAFQDACLSFVSLVRVQIEPGRSILDPEHEDAIAEAVDGFSTWVADRFEIEPSIRCALAWLLNLDQQSFTATIGRLDISFPVRGDLEVLRTFFETLWAATFADWRMPRFDPAEYPIKGLRHGDPSALPRR